jgi:hypothetical protein
MIDLVALAPEDQLTRILGVFLAAGIEGLVLPLLTDERWTQSFVHLLKDSPFSLMENDTGVN